MSMISIPEAEALYRQLQVFPFTRPGETFSFLDRLAKENNWDRSDAEVVLEEYRRFLVLAMFAGHPVTPSDQVDQAWHLHMVYTHSYWDELCGKLLGKPLHHEPSRGGAQEMEKFRTQYTQTLNSYQKIFSEKPPVAIWPAPEDCFSKAADVQRKNDKAVPASKKFPGWKWVIVAASSAVAWYLTRSWFSVIIVGVIVFNLLSSGMGSGGGGFSEGGDSGCDAGGGCGSGGCGGCGGG